MIRYFLLSILFCVVVAGCTTKTHSTEKEKLKLQIQIIPEGITNDSIPYHALWWKIPEESDTTLFRDVKDPEEIWCIILNSGQDTLGYYMGRSTPMPFTYFNATDSIIHIRFMIGVNFFSEAIKTEAEYEKLIKQIEKPIEFEPIEVNINQHLRDTLEIEVIKM